MEEAPTTKAIHLRVRGRVQGVGFRYATAQAARRLGVTGWVRNDTDGSVEVWAEGPPDAVDRLERFVRVGPMAATVDAVVATPGVPRAGSGTFEVRF